MEVTNKTNYDTRYLRRIFIACERHEGTNHKGRYVTVKSSPRATWVSGYAWINTTSVVMKLPKQGNASTKSIAQVYIHEVGHNLGLRHTNMASVCQIDVSWLKDNKYLGNDYKEIAPQKTKKTQPKKSLVEKRAETARKHLDEWTRKLKRAKTAVTKYKKQTTYYEKRMAATKVEQSNENERTKN